MPNQRGFAHILVIILIVLVVLAAGFFAYIWFGMGWQLQDIDVNNPPKFIQADFIDLDKVTSITKFRSGWGHTYAANGEQCRSMKHEFQWKKPNQPSEFEKKEMELSRSGVSITSEVIAQLKRDALKSRDESLAVNFYSPVDGWVVSTGESSGVGNLIEIRPDNAPKWRIKMYHVWIDPKIHLGSHLQAGQTIGKSYLDIGWGDIAINYRYVGGERFVSYFQVLPDNLFAKYQVRGIKSRNDLIISKEYRDAHPLKCLDNHGQTSDYAENYANTPQGHKENIFDLN